MRASQQISGPLAAATACDCSIAYNTLRGRAADFKGTGWTAVTRDDIEQAYREISSWSDYSSTPLRRLDGIANALGIEWVLYKDESCRFGLGSFKALGAGYAIARLFGVVARTGVHVGSSPEKRRERPVTIAAATDGNHGRAVAWAARRFDCECVVYVPKQCTAARRAAIESLGGKVTQTDKGYDDTVRICLLDAVRNSWFVVSDTSWPGYESIPALIMAGYTVLTTEMLRELDQKTQRPTHVFVQAGVGGLAAAVCAHLWQHWGKSRPKMIVVEPENAACVYASAAVGELTRAAEPVETIMAGLSCAEPSPLAWRLLRHGADFFMTVTDPSVAPCMRLLANGSCGDDPVVAGESAVAGLAALLCAARAPSARQVLGLDARSRVLLIGTEGDTDPEIYERIVGKPANLVRDRQRRCTGRQP